MAVAAHRAEQHDRALVETGRCTDAGWRVVATAELWDEHFENVYALADAVMDRVVAEA